MNEPLISIVMTNYNGEQFLKETIQSVLRQTYPNWELIIVDDCSTDNSLSVIREFQDCRIRVYQNSTNLHVAQAHNEGNSHVRGEFMAILDNDDLWDCRKLEIQYGFLKAHPEYDACFTWPKFIDENSIEFRNEWLYQLFCVPNRSHIAWIHDLLTTGNHLANDSVLLRTASLQDVGKENICFSQLHDFHMWMRFVLRHPFYLIEEPLLSYRRYQKSGSITAVSDENNRRSDFEFCWIIGNTILQMEPALFTEVFRNEMINPTASGKEEIECEKAFLLSRDDILHENCKFFAFSLFERLFRDPAAAAILNNQYHFTQHDVFKMTGTPIIFSKRMGRALAAAKKEAAEYREQYQNVLEAYQKASRDIVEMQNSTSWKITSPLRGLISRLKKS